MASDTALHDPKRLAVLEQTGLMGTTPEPEFDRLSELAARLLEAPIAYVSLLDEERQFFKSQVGLEGRWAEERGSPASESFCQHVVRTGDPLVIPDTREHPLGKDNSAVTAQNALAYLGLPLETGDGFVLGSFCVMDHEPRAWTDDDVDTLRDLAASVATELELRRTARRLERAVHARDEILSIVSHDLRNPLNTIGGAAQLLEMQWPDSEQRERPKGFAIIDRSVDRMDRMIQDLLDVGRIEAGGLSVAADREPVAPIMREVIEAHESDAVVNDLRLETELASPLPAVRADRARLVQIFGNLVGNALKFTPEGGRITLAAEARDAVVRFTVRDTGDGIPPDQLEHLFDRFWQAHRGDRRGVGLGLAIVKGLVDAHGGEIQVESTVGEGTAFAFTIPRAGRDESPARAEVAAQTAAESAGR